MTPVPCIAVAIPVRGEASDLVAMEVRSYRRDDTGALKETVERFAYANDGNLFAISESDFSVFVAAGR